MPKKLHSANAQAAPDDSPRFDRRTALKGLGATALVGMAPGCRSEPVPLDFELLRSRIDTVVYLMMENRSFDHYFGALTLNEDRVDIDGLTADMSNPHPDGSAVTPYPTSVACLEDPPHSWGSSREQFADGTNSGFVQAFYDRHPDPELAKEVMAYLGRDELPAFYELLDRSTLCDRWFCSQMSSTWPNRFYSLAGQNGGERGNDLTAEGFPSIITRLEDAGISWANYFSNVPFAALLSDLPEEPPFYRIEDFFLDAQLGRLPQFVMVEPVYGRADDHPPAHHLAGQIFVASIYRALAQSRQWNRTLLVITYDEHGGYFDHVPPPTAADDRAGEGWEQLGFRVPTLVCGPWVKPGHVSKVNYDHTSVLAFIENLWGLEPLTARDAAADPMLDVFDHGALVEELPHAPVALGEIEADEEVIFAPECTEGLAHQHGVTGQPELEAEFDRRPELRRWDRRSETDAVWEAVLREAEKLGVWKRGDGTL